VELPWSRDRSFWALTATQFLGAFNDNVFKQLVLLLCVDQAIATGTRDQQGLAQVFFAAPFILFSGLAGFLSDRYSKRSIVFLCKLAEIGIALVGMAAFGLGGLGAPFAVLFLMGTHSAFFGPPKYGILPELFHEHDLPRVNGVVLMTTFLAIILAFPLAGALKMAFTGEIWKASFACVALAMMGTATASLVRRTAPARPGLELEPAGLLIHPSTWKAMREQPGLMKALLASSVFWLAGGVVYPNVVNSVGKVQLGLDDKQTGYLASCMGLGILIGCLVAGWLSQNQFRAKLVRMGAWGMALTLLILAIPGDLQPAPPPASTTPIATISSAVPAAPPTSSTVDLETPKELHTVWLGVYGSGFFLVLLGLSAGLFSVPVQVYLQARAPTDQKGRVIGVMNLMNWIAIALAGAYYGLASRLLEGFKAQNLVFAAAALTVVPLLLFYHPKDEALR
jgi:acyl-[acyl-carrier-protein]-phospholipid O-acyltransferase/long-chain-fatty-acid--[acyl-carrier-protein] ligase